jgi:hypothetical protein
MIDGIPSESRVPAALTAALFGEHVVRRADQETFSAPDRRRGESQSEDGTGLAGKSQRTLARLGGFSERRLSDIFTGWAQAREDEQRVLAALLGTTVEALFDADDPVAEAGTRS